MRRYERMLVGLAGLLVLGAVGARENPVSPAPFDTFAMADAMTLAAGPAATITPAIVRRIERELRDNCTVSENPSYVEGREFWGGGMGPALGVFSTLKYTFGIDPVGAVRTVVTRAPLHGRVDMIGLATQSFPGMTFEVFQYTPTPNFLGDDRVAFAVTVNGQRFRVSYVIHVQKEIDEDICLPPGMDRGELEPDVQIVLDELVPVFGYWGQRLLGPGSRCSSAAVP